MAAVLLILAVFLRLMLPICSQPQLPSPPPPSPFNPPANLKLNHTLGFFREDPFPSYVDTARADKETWTAGMVSRTFLKPQPPPRAGREGIVKIHVFLSALHFMVCCHRSGGRTTLLAAGCPRNTEFYQPFFMFLHFPSPRFLTYNFAVYSFFPFLLCCGGFSPRVVFSPLFLFLPYSIVT